MAMLRRFKSIKRTLEFKISLIFLMTIVLSAAIIVGIAYSKSYDLLIDHLGQRSIKIAQTAALKIDTEAFKTLKTVADERTKAYQNMRADLNQLREWSGVKYLYTMTKNNNGEFIYVVDGSASDELSHIGDIEEFSSAYESAWQGNRYIGKSISIGLWGTLISSYYPIRDKYGKVIGFVGVDYDVKEEYETFKKFGIMLINVSIVLVLVSILFGVLLSKRIAAPIKKLVKLMQQVEKGDLSVKSDITTKDEIGNLAGSFNKMVSYLAQLLKNFHHNSEEMQRLGEDLNNAVQNIRVQAYTIDANVGEIATGMEQTSASVEEITAASSEVIDDLKALRARANSSYQRVVEIKERATGMKKDVELSNSVIQAMYQEKQAQMIKAIEDGRVILQIKDMAEIIAVISEKIHLLAINTAIEAARSGQQGKGFAVVAEEVRRLSNQSKQSVKQINELVKAVQEAFLRLSATSKSMLEFIDDKVTKDYESLVDTGVRYLKDAQAVETLIGDFVNRSEQAERTVTEVGCAIESVAQAVEQMTARLQDISLSTNETAKTTEKVAIVAAEQANSAGQLNIISKKLFEIN